MFRVESKNAEDEVLQAMKAIVQSGWPAERRELPLYTLYYDIRDELVIQDGLLSRRQARGA